MIGIKINNKHSSNKSEIKIDYGFDELINPIQDLIKNYYWITNDVLHSSYDINKNNIDFDEENFESMIIEEDVCARLMKPAYLSSFAKNILGDWDSIYGVIDKDIFKRNMKLDYKFIVDNVEIAFNCIDAAFWEVYCKDEKMLELLVESFPNSERYLIHE